MPSVKAVLRDINDQGLDPKKAYKQTSSGGRLSGVPVDRSAPKYLAEHPPAKPLKSALVELPEPKKAEPKPEPVEVKEVVTEAVAETVQSAVESEAPKKKADKSVKKADKKDKPEDPPVS